MVVVVVVAVGVLVLSQLNTPGTAATTTTSRGATVTTATGGGGSGHGHGTTTTTVPATTTTTVPPTTTTTVAPSSVTVLVLNGTTTPHAALFFQSKLSKQGFDTLAPNNAAINTVQSSQIFIAKGGAASTDAYQIAGIVGVGPAAVVMPSPTNDSAIPPSMLSLADIVVVIGSDITKQVPAGYAG